MKKHLLMAGGILFVVIVLAVLFRMDVVPDLLRRGPNADIRPTPKGEFAYQNTNKEYTASFVAKEGATTTAAAKIDFGGSSITMRMLRADGSIVPVDMSKVSVQKAAATSSRDRKDVLTIPDVYPSTDLEYRMVNGGLKEDIVAKSSDVVYPGRMPADSGPPPIPQSPRYPFAVTLDGVQPKKNADGTLSPVFYRIADGKYAFHLAKPVMIDANGAESYDVIMKMRQTTPQDPWYMAPGDVKEGEKVPVTQYVLLMEPSAAWLADPVRAYPVRIDPTVLR